MLPSSFYLPDIEQHFLGLLLNNPEVYGEVSQVTRSDFSPVRQRIFDVIKQALDTQQPVTPIILVEKLKSYGQSETDVGGTDILTYLEGLQMRGKLIEKKEAVNLLKELKRMTVKRELTEKCDEAKAKIKNAKTFDEMVGAVEATLTSVNTEYFRAGQSEDMFESLIQVVEERGQAEEDFLGYVGVLPSIDKTLGPLIHPGSFCNISARSGSGKSSIGFFYAVSTVEKYEDMNLLWLDAGEMTLQQIQFRAVCCFSQGRVPLWALRSGAWRKNKEWVDIIRGEVWPRVKRLTGRIDYRSVGGLTTDEKVSCMRRHYFNRVGRDRFLVVVDDYLKGVEALGKNSNEFQAVGYYAAKVKDLVTEEINGGYMTFTQSNRSGITKGKKADDIVDNDSVISLSDRITHNTTANFVMRYKVPEELAREKNAYGNIVLKNLKIREATGREYEKFARPIKTDKGFAEDYFNLNYQGFYYRDMGLYSEMLQNLGHTAVDLSDGKSSPKIF